MSGVNKVILLGYLGKDPEVRTLDSGKKVARFTMATTETYKNKSGEKVDKTEWHNIVFWGPVVDVIQKYLSKGKQVYVEGKIITRSYDDKGGVKKYITEIEGQQLTLIGSKKSSLDDEQNDVDTEGISESIRITDDTDDLPF